MCRTSWTGEPKTSNGAYGVYPVQCENVLIDGCVVRGAADAGVYVGQSRRIVVKNCNVHENVAGIEIENSFDADVFDNFATNNSGGILVFDLPGLDVHNGGRVRVFHNKVPKNNHPNFGAPGSSVSNVAPGTGMLLLAMDNVEIFENEITDNNTAGLQVISYILTGNPINDPKYDPYPEHAYIHDNHISGGGKHPGGRYGKMLAGLLGKPFPEIFYDGVLNPKHVKDGKLPPKYAIRFERNGNVKFANIHFDRLSPEKIAAGKIDVDRNIANYTGSFPRPGGDPSPAARGGRSGQRHERPDLPGRAAKTFRIWPLQRERQHAGTGRRLNPVRLNTPLFSDYTSKHRFVRLPAGLQVGYRENDVLNFPVGTQIVKTFAMPHDMTDAKKGERLIETRIIEHKPTGWYGYAYVWNKEQTEATLALGGTTVDVSWKHSDGSLRTNNYIVPHANQCKSCHMATEKTFLPLGPKARNLNKEFAYHGGKENQLTHWTKIGALRDCAGARQSAPRARGSTIRPPARWKRGPACGSTSTAPLPQPARPRPHDGARPAAEPEQSGENRRLQIAGRRRPRLGRKQVRHRPRQAGRIDRALPARIDRTGRDDARTPPPPRPRRSGEPASRMDRPDESARQASQHKVTERSCNAKVGWSVRVLSDRTCDPVPRGARRLDFFQVVGDKLRLVGAKRSHERAFDDLPAGLPVGLRNADCRAE